MILSINIVISLILLSSSAVLFVKFLIRTKKLSSFQNKTSLNQSNTVVNLRSSLDDVSPPQISNEESKISICRSSHVQNEVNSTMEPSYNAQDHFPLRKIRKLQIA